MNIYDRAQAVEFALKKYRNTEFVWGKTDCLHLARSVLVKFGAKGLPRIPSYTNEKSAMRQLVKQGHKSLESLLGEYCMEIPPALSIIGDIGTVKGDNSLSAIVVYTGSAWLGWPEDYPTFAVVKLTPERVFRYV